MGIRHGTIRLVLIYVSTVVTKKWQFSLRWIFLIWFWSHWAAVHDKLVEIFTSMWQSVKDNGSALFLLEIDFSRPVEASRVLFLLNLGKIVKNLLWTAVDSTSWQLSVLPKHKEILALCTEINKIRFLLPSWIQCVSPAAKPDWSDRNGWYFLSKLNN